MTKKSIPYTVIGGYLGAGKTTLLNHLLQDNRGLRLAILVNDFGSINIDASLIASHDGETINLASGCICCNLADGFSTALHRLSKRWGEIDHIIVEASGVADPVKIGHYGAILNLALDGVIVLVDAEQIRTKAANKYVGDTVIRQLKGADLLVLNKVDLVTPAELMQVRDWLNTLAPGMRIFETTYGQVPTAVLFGVHHDAPGAVTADEEHDHGEEHEHTEMYSSGSIRIPELIRTANLQSTLNSLPESILRAKGFVSLAEEPTRRHVLQLVGRRWTISAGEPWGDELPETQLVFIGLRDSVDIAQIIASLTEITTT